MQPFQLREYFFTSGLSDSPAAMPTDRVHDACIIVVVPDIIGRENGCSHSILGAAKQRRMVVKAFPLPYRIRPVSALTTFI